MASMMFVSACNQGSESQLVSNIDSFSTAYFNWQFQRAVPLCTPESKRWLSYMASQVNQADVDSLKAQPQGATFEVGNVSYQDGDSLANVEVTVSHFLSMDTLGRAAQPVEKARFVIPVAFRNGLWRVNLSSPLRPERD